MVSYLGAIVRANHSSEKKEARVQNKSRRQFIRRLGASATAMAGASAGLSSPLLAKATNLDGNSSGFSGSGSKNSNPVSGSARRSAVHQYRISRANALNGISLPPHENNGDENLYPSKIGNFSKGLPHNNIGEVDVTAYSALFTAAKNGFPSDWDAVPMGGTVKLVNPQCGLAFDLEGLDASMTSLQPAPATASEERADEMVELYWQALCRDVPFDQYGNEPLTQGAIAELNALKAFRGPRQDGEVTPQTLFRLGISGDTVGPYISQFLLHPVSFGPFSFTQLYNTYQPGLDYLTDFPSYLNVRNGIPTGQKNVVSGAVYLHTGRDLAAWVHVDALIQAYFMGLLWCLGNGVPFNPGNPYLTSKNQAGFGTFGGPHVIALMSEASTRALQHVWWEKWYVHRCLRPEEFGGLVQNVKTGVSRSNLHSDVLNSTAAAMVNAQRGNWLLPQVFPEGCPQHPSYGSGHSTVAGACVTVLKAFFDTHNTPVPDRVYSPDGVTLVPYTRADADQITVETELNKLAMNIPMGRDYAGIHWRSDEYNSVFLGEAVAIGLLADQKARYNELFQGFTFYKFDGTEVTI